MLSVAADLLDDAFDSALLAHVLEEKDRLSWSPYNNDYDVQLLEQSGHSTENNCFSFCTRFLAAVSREPRLRAVWQAGRHPLAPQRRRQLPALTNRTMRAQIRYASTADHDKFSLVEQHGIADAVGAVERYLATAVASRPSNKLPPMKSFS